MDGERSGGRTFYFGLMERPPYNLGESLGKIGRDFDFRFQGSVDWASVFDFC